MRNPQTATANGVDRTLMRDFDDLSALMRIIAAGDPPSREQAVSYLDYRTRLLASPHGSMLPGFLYQCGTINRFRDFIFLYDPDVELRCEFIDRMIGRARALAERPEPRPTPRPVGAASPAKTSPWDF